eukprot:TRINITY_DN9321_c0_g5_i1.p1 TRINITY_DN9321_c0_g5~~TRINITY_DN9321_c0_g5_i1.p1  ORF type:complete len:354 (+),score=106.71 TRINITY_DN9321_c0_g5_i1:206-1267(+)
MELTIEGRYRLVDKLGSGSFGEVYKAVDLKTSALVAVKLEPANCLHPQLKYEAKVYEALEGGVGIPRIYWHGLAGDYYAMVIDHLGPSLDSFFALSHRRFSLKTVLMLAEQMLQRIEFFHSHFFLHRDVKPANFLLGLGKNQDMLYIIDYGLAKKYYNASTGEHIEYREDKCLTGTVRYASVNTHLGIEQSRRDDLECVGYVLLYFLRGTLPWQGLKASTRRKRYQCIKEVKMSTPVSVLCRGLPKAFGRYMNYCRSLQFADKPDYASLRRNFHNLFRRSGYKWDCVYDWTLPVCEPKGAQSTDESCAVAEKKRARPEPEGRAAGMRKRKQKKLADVFSVLKKPLIPMKSRKK